MVTHCPNCRALGDVGPRYGLVVPECPGEPVPSSRWQQLTDWLGLACLVGVGLCGGLVIGVGLANGVELWPW
jgi:hypothetical protein